MQKRILVVSHDPALRDSRSALLLSAGYAVSAVGGNDEAMALMVGNSFDLVLIGRNSQWPKKGLDERVRALHPYQLIVKIAQGGEPRSSFCSRMVDSVPANVLEAVHEVLQGRGAYRRNRLAASDLTGVEES
jgi:DNA-binding NtrC family response regulator